MNNRSQSYQFSPNILCQIHNQPYKLFCIEEGCNALSRAVCKSCALEGPHERHKSLPLIELFQKLQNIKKYYFANRQENNNIEMYKKQLLNAFSNIRDIFQDRLCELYLQIEQTYDFTFVNDKVFQIPRSKLEQLIEPSLLDQHNDQESLKFFSEIFFNPKPELLINSYLQNNSIQVNSYVIQEQLNQANLLLNNTIEKLQNIFMIHQFTQKEQFDVFQFKGKANKTLNGHNDQINCITQLDDQHFATGSQDKSIRIWNIKVDSTVQMLNGHTNTINTLQKINDNFLMSGSFDKTIILWDWKQGKFLKKYIGHKSCVNCILQLNREQAISCSDDQTIKVWDIESGKMALNWLAHDSYINSIILVNTQLLLSFSKDQFIKVWQIGKEIFCQKSQNMKEQLIKAVWLQISKIGCSTYSGKILILTFPDLLQEQIFDSHQRAIYSLQLLNDNFLISGSEDETFIIWLWREGKIYKNLKNQGQQVNSVIPFGINRIISSCANNVLIWE